MEPVIRHPVYVLARDDYSFMISDFTFEERTDVEEGLYEGWDSDGRHFTLAWDEKKDRPFAVVDRDDDTGRFLAAAKEYERRYSKFEEYERRYSKFDPRTFCREAVVAAEALMAKKRHPHPDITSG